MRIDRATRFTGWLRTWWSAPRAGLATFFTAKTGGVLPFSISSIPGEASSQNAYERSYQMQPEPKQEQQETQRTERQIVEILAFALTERGTGFPPPSYNILGDASSARDTWQEEADFRAAGRAEAKNLLAVLAECGLRLRPSDSKQLGKTLDWLKTVPPKPAYSDDEMVE